MPTVVLSAICVCVVLLLAVVNMFTAPVIEAALEQEVQASLSEVMSNGGSFEEITDLEGLPKEITAAYKAENGGYVFKAAVVGYKSGLIIMCGIDGDGKISGVKMIESSETFGAEATLDGLFAGKTESDYNTVPVISGATLTRNGYGQAVKAAFEAFDKLEGGN
jgi:electron transport complex protein RnfG